MGPELPRVHRARCSGSTSCRRKNEKWVPDPGRSSGRGTGDVRVTACIGMGRGWAPGLACETLARLGRIPRRRREIRPGGCRLRERRLPAAPRTPRCAIHPLRAASLTIRIGSRTPQIASRPPSITIVSLSSGSRPLRTALRKIQDASRKRPAASLTRRIAFHGRPAASRNRRTAFHRRPAASRKRRAASHARPTAIHPRRTAVRRLLVARRRL